MGCHQRSCYSGNMLPPLQTGQRHCYDERGVRVACAGTGQDGEFQAGRPWPQGERFEPLPGGAVRDRLTGLVWSGDANPFDFPLPWQEALDRIAGLNAEGYLGHHDWRLPNRRELRSLMDYAARRPALPAGHPFRNVFLGWYWTSTTAAIHPAYAWYVHLDGARMFYGRKDQEYLAWPVRGRSQVLAATGQRECFSVQGRRVPCKGTGQDGELRQGVGWSAAGRFAVKGDVVWDQCTGLCWLRRGDLASEPVSWRQALDRVAALNKVRHAGRGDWRLPNINELESLVDCSQHSPALPREHPFLHLQDVYWSSTTSFFEPDWAWALYLEKGALGVGHKPGRTFFVWPVAGGLD